MAILEANDLTQVYGRGTAAVTALDHVSISIEPREFVAIMGPSGSGKSTMLHLLGGLDAPTEGKVMVDGTDLSKLDDKALTILRRTKIGFVFQFFNLIPVLNALENVALPLVLNGSQSEATERARAWLQRVELADRMTHRPSELSGGQQQRVALARALVTEPAVILADEPTGNLDSRGAEEMLRWLRRSVDEWGRTVVMVTHDPRMAAYADRIIFMKDGTIVDDTLLGVNKTPEMVLEKMETFMDQPGTPPANGNRGPGTGDRGSGIGPRADPDPRSPIPGLRSPYRGLKVNTYLAIPTRYLVGRKLRTVLTTLAIVFGVAVVFAVNMLLPAFTGALEASEMGVTGQVDMTVTSASGGPFRADVLDTIAQTNGVAAAAPSFQRSVTLPSGAITSFDVIGLDPTSAETVRYYQVTDGRFLNGDDKLAVALSQHLAQELGLRAGDIYKLPTPRGLVDLSVVGVFNTPAATDQMLAPLSTAQELFGAPGQVSAIDVAIKSGTDRESVKQALQAKLGTSYNVGSALATNALAQDLQLGLVVFNIFGILTLFMGAFLIFNTFRTVVVERRHDIGMLRAVGATRGMIVRLILVESALQGIVGTAIGVLLGYLLGLALTGAFQSVMDQFMRVRLSVVVPPEAIILSVVLGIGMTMLAGLLPALSAGRVPVLAALREEQVAPARRRAGIGAIIGGVLIVLGIAGILTGNPGVAAFGSVLILVGLVMMTSLLINPIARVLDPVMRRVFASEGQLAEGNLRRNPGRASITVSALLIGLAVIVALYSGITSIESAYINRLNKSNGADILLLPPNLVTWNSDVGVGQDFERKLAQVPGVGDVAGLGYAPARVSGVDVQVLGLDPASYPKVSGLVFDKGDDSAYAELNNGRTAIINGILATALRAKIGDELPVQTPDGVKNYRIAAIGTDYLGAKTNTVYTSKQNLANDWGVTDDVMVMANLKQSVDAAVARTGVQALVQGYPQLTLYWGADWRQNTADVLDQLFLGLYIALAALIIPSMLGLINTLAINVLERTREIGVLRAIGTTRGQIRRMIVAESLLLGIAGTALGLLAGLALGYAFTTVVDANFYTVNFSVPVGPIILAVALALILTLLASVLPARQAARVKIVQALQYE